MSEWKEIKKHPGYFISCDGQIKNPRGKLLKTHPKNGYLCICLQKKKDFSIHRLVAKYFVPNPNNYLYVNHINEDKKDNRHVNLQWVTQKMNVKHSIESGKTIQTTVAVRCFKNGTFIKEYPSVEEARKAINLTRHAVIRACKKKCKTAGGFEWEYVKPKKGGTPKDGKEIMDFPNYLITSEGRVYSKHSKHYLKLMPNKNGYVYVTLCNKGKKKNHYVHCLVAKHWIENPNNGTVVNHIDGNKKNNCITNLEWITQSENVKHWHQNRHKSFSPKLSGKPLSGSGENSEV